MFIDTHLHLTDKAYSDIKKYISESEDEQVQILITCGYNQNSNNKIIDLIKEYDNVYGTIGYSPQELANITDYNLDEFKLLLKHNKIIGIGEIGLDYHYTKENKKEQKELFIKQIDLAIEYKKPIVVHSRDSLMDTYEILSNYKGKITGVIHCYSYSSEMASKFIQLGFLIGIGGVVTFDNSITIKEVVKDIPIEAIVLETDAPYLTPMPFRGQLNHSKYIPIMASEIAKLKGISLEEVRNITSRNAEGIFNLK